MALRRVEHLYRHAGQGQGAAFGQIDLDEHDLEQRTRTRTLKTFEDILEGQLLMVERRRNGVASAHQCTAEVRVVLQALANHQGIEQWADQRCEFRTVTLRRRGAQAQVRLAAVARQQTAERCQAVDVQRHPVITDGRLDRRCEVRREFPGQDRATVAALCGQGARAVQRQRHWRRCIGQLVAPKIDVLLATVAVQPFTLPRGVIGVLDGQLG